MSRDIATVIQNALGDDVIEPFFAVDLGFDSGTLRLWTGIGSKTSTARNMSALATSCKYPRCRRRQRYRQQARL
jgi:hypothetical protein